MNEESNSMEYKIFVTIANHDLLNCVCCRNISKLQQNGLHLICK